MCGISLFIGTNAETVAINTQKLFDFQKHRGPDGGITKQFDLPSRKSIGLAHNLLAITGTQNLVSQPLIHQESNTVLLFNGEVYNYQALKKVPQLQVVTWQSDTDTEVLLQLLLKLKLPALQQVDGMFALALADLSQEVIILARDAAGMKPLYYHTDADGNFMVASELNAIAKCMPKPILNKVAASDILRYKYCKAANTIIEDVFELMPGQYLIWNKGNIELGFWAPKVSEKPHLHIVQHKLKALLTEGIANEVEGISNPALLLSGGIDSTLILAGLAAAKVANITAYTAVPTSVNDADTKAAELAAQTFGATWKPITYSEKLLAQIPAYCAETSNPVADAAGLITWHLSKQIDPSHKVLLSGAGADELFLGYNRHYAFDYYLQFPKLLANPAIKGLLKGVNLFLGSKQLTHFLDSITDSNATTWDNMKANNGFSANVLPHFKAPTLNHSQAESSPLDFIAQDDRFNYLPYDILNITDSAAMASGKEVRMPFLNTPLWNMINGMVAGQFIEQSSKWVLKNMLVSLGGKAFIKRKKKGFGINWSAWLYNTSEGKALLSELKDSSVAKTLVSTSFLNEVLTKKQLAQPAMSLLFLHYWIKANGVSVN